MLTLPAGFLILIFGFLIMPFRVVFSLLEIFELLRLAAGRWSGQKRRRFRIFSHFFLSGHYVSSYHPLFFTASLLYTIAPRKGGKGSGKKFFSRSKRYHPIVACFTSEDNPGRIIRARAKFSEKIFFLGSSTSKFSNFPFLGVSCAPRRVYSTRNRRKPNINRENVPHQGRKCTRHCLARYAPSIFFISHYGPWPYSKHSTRFCNQHQGSKWFTGRHWSIMGNKKN